MDMLLAIWLPIVLAAAAAWFWSFLSWAILGIHKPETRKLPDEDAFLNAVRSLNLPPANYFFPYLEHNTKDPAALEKWHRGPCGKLSIWSPNVNMAGNMLATLGVCLLTAFLIGYVASVTLPRGTDFMRVFQVCGTMGVLGYSFSQLPNLIWFQGGKRAMVTCVFDGIVQGLATGLIFAALWPK